MHSRNQDEEINGNTSYPFHGAERTSSDDT